MKFVDVSRYAGRTILQAKQNSPRIMFVVGLVSVGASVVLASRATLKLDETLGKNLDVVEDLNALKATDMVEREYLIQEKVFVVAQMAFDVTKLYGPAIVVGGFGVACLTGSHNMLTKRNAALTAAYVGLERTFNTYRGRVREEFGEEREAALHRDVSRELALKDKEDSLAKLGKGKSRFPGYSDYAKFFDECSSQWKRNPEKNLYFLSCQQRWLNEKLHMRGYLFLNEVYESLGLPPTSAGCVVGWTMYGDGDNFVDFGIFDHHTNEVRNFVNGVENSVLLDFNVDGLIADKIER